MRLPFSFAARLFFLLSGACKKSNSAAESKRLKAGTNRMRVGHLGLLVCAKEFVQRFQSKALRSVVSQK